MDFFTAGIALTTTLLCVALVMTGIYSVAPSEGCTRYWALSETLIALGVLLLVVNAGAPRYAIIILGNNSVVLGSILQMWGVQAFFGKPPAKTGWVIGVVFFVMHGLLLAVSADVFPRVILLSATMLIVLALSFRAVWNGTASRRSFSAWLVLGAAAMLIANNTVRMVAALLGLLAVRPFSNSVAAVIIIYLVPLAGILLYTSGLVLLFFERIVREKHHLATHDELTGLLNRRAIAAAGEREVTVALRNRQALTVSIVDIDFFKRINDNMGHEAGDVALAEIARLLKGCCRSSDLVGRYGGEEFCIVFPGADSAKAAMLGERLVAAARTYRFRDRYPVTVSAGLATLSADDIDRSWSHLINRADAELYRAKGRGRDGFCLSSHGTAAATDTSLVEPAGASAQQA